ncbi:MAG: class I SAM-dependent methyltransferase [Actinobacteria bacterium]|nr:class I SAM-dependent methyltransferase [Actinomycetota bacterium]
MRDPRNIGHRLTARHRFLCGMAGELKDEAVLDLGCGFGWFEKYAVEQGCNRVVGVDLDERLIDRSRRDVPGAEFLLRDATEISASIGKFSVVSMFDFLEHLAGSKLVDVLRRVNQLLEAEGRLLISVPYQSFLSNALDPAFFFGHRHYSIKDLEIILGSTGFKVSSVVYAGGSWEQISMIWLYIFKWVFRREMPFADFLERKRLVEYKACQQKPGLKSYATMFVEAIKGDQASACEP